MQQEIRNNTNRSSLSSGKEKLLRRLLMILLFIFGFATLIYASLFLILTLPKMLGLYKDIGIEYGSLAFSIILSVVIIAFAILEIGIGVKIKRQEHSEPLPNKLLMWGVGCLLVSLLVIPIIIAFSLISTLLPIYNLTSSF